jgi:hypothetical protein
MAPSYGLSDHLLNLMRLVVGLRNLLGTMCLLRAGEI